MNRPLLAAALAALALPAAASAHVLVNRASLEPGERATIAVTVTNAHAARLQEVVVSAGSAQVQRPAGVLPGESSTVSFTIVAPQTGEVVLRVEQRFADGTEERQEVRLPVREPDPPMRLGRALVAALAGLLALALGLAVLARRRARLQES